MIKRMELVNPSSCFNKADAEEPIFVLRANDPIAAQTIRLWASMAPSFHEKEKINLALMDAAAFEEWRLQHPRAEDK